MLMKNPLTSDDMARYESFTQNPEATSFVDSNQIYLLGFSARGDGVYRLSTNLADRFAAVDMSAGHPGDVQFDNLANTPICLQVGDEDNAYDRNTVTVDVTFKLDALALRHPGLYTHSCYVHVTRPGAWAHNSWSEIETGYARGPVLTDLHTWRNNPEAGQQHQVMMNTNAVDWVSRLPSQSPSTHRGLEPSVSPPARHITGSQLAEQALLLLGIPAYGYRRDRHV